MTTPQGRQRSRALDLGTVQVWLEGDAPRVTCLDHGVVTASVPWECHGAVIPRPRRHASMAGHPLPEVGGAPS